MAWRVLLEDGPAAGWGYITFIAPDARIIVAPAPPQHGNWMRVLDESWPDAAVYARRPGGWTEGADMVALYKLAAVRT